VKSLITISRLFLLSFFLSGFIYAQTGWHIQDSGISARLYSVHFVDTTNGWAAGDGGVMLYTIDGGTELPIHRHNQSFVFSLLQ
jgi:hypothetical protein